MGKGRSWDETGRACTNPNCSHGGVHQPWTRFNLDKRHPSGHKTRCRTCTQQADRRLRLVGIVIDGRCENCGEPVEGRNAYCRTCAMRYIEFKRKDIALIVKSRDRSWTGGHFPLDQFEDLVTFGFLEPGTIVEWWHRGSYVLAWQIVGDMCQEDAERSDVPQTKQEVYGHMPVGDKTYLRAPSPPMVFFTFMGGSFDDALIQWTKKSKEKLGKSPKYLYLWEECECEITTDLTVVYDPMMYTNQVALSAEPVVME